METKDINIKKTGNKTFTEKKIPTIWSAKLSNGIHEAVMEIWSPAEPLLPASPARRRWTFGGGTAANSPDDRKLFRALGFVRDQARRRELLGVIHVQESVQLQHPIGERGDHKILLRELKLEAYLSLIGMDWIGGLQFSQTARVDDGYTSKVGSQDKNAFRNICLCLLKPKPRVSLTLHL